MISSSRSVNVRDGVRGISCHLHDRSPYKYGVSTVTYKYVDVEETFGSVVEPWFPTLVSPRSATPTGRSIKRRRRGGNKGLSRHPKGLSPRRYGDSPDAFG